MGPQARAQAEGMKQAPRVVLDTNVALSALVFREGLLASLRVAWQSGRIRPLASKATASELVRVLAYPKFRLREEEREALLAEYLPWCTVVKVPVPGPKVPQCPDPDDLPFLQLAVAGKARFLATGDKALLGMRGRLPFRVVPAAELLSEAAGA